MLDLQTAVTIDSTGVPSFACLRSCEIVMPSCVGANGPSTTAKLDVLGTIEEFVVQLDVENV